MWRLILLLSLTACGQPSTLRGSGAPALAPQGYVELCAEQAQGPECPE